MDPHIIIPAYNEEKSIGKVIQTLKNHNYNNIIVIDDGSKDNTEKIAKQENITVLKHIINRGQGAALQTGMTYALREGAEMIIHFDADGQHDAQILPKIVAPLAVTGIDLVIGIRDRGGRLSEVLFNRYASWRYGVNDILCGLKAYRMAIYHACGPFDATSSIGTGLAIRALRLGVGFETVRVPITARQDEARMGSIFRANMRILRALSSVIVADIFARNQPGRHDQRHMNVH